MLAGGHPSRTPVAVLRTLNRLITNHWADVDDNGGIQPHEFYLPDARYAVGNNRFEGEEKIRAFYDRRRQRGNTTTRRSHRHGRNWQQRGNRRF